MEKIIETKICKHCNSNFEITDKDMEFYEKVSPKVNGEKYLIPTPTFCPTCRQQRRLSFRNERNLYRRKSDITQKDIISIYSPDKKFKVYDSDYWWSDNWSPLDYGRDFDFNKTFFEQFKELFIEIPRLNLHVVGSENSNFINQCGYSKDCYLSFNTDYSEQCYYCKNVFKCKNCMDLLNADNSENCYNSVDIKNCYKGFFIQECKDSSNIYYSYNLESCTDCFGCVNLVNKKNYIFNVQYTQSEYDEKLKEIFKNIENNINLYKNLKLKLPHIYANIKNSENVLGNNLVNCKDLKFCFDCFSDENISYCSVVSDAKNIYDFDIGGYISELNYEMISSGDRNMNSCFNTNLWGNNSNIYYSDLIIGCTNLFGCVCLRDKSYCILNKQYTKEEYEILVPKIIEHMKKTGEWGEFFPSSISPFGYNETVANENFPLIKEEAVGDPQGVPLQDECRDAPCGYPKNNIFNRSDYENPFPKVQKIIPASKLPDDITKIPDDILNRAIKCEVTNKPFRIIKQELEFYRKFNLPIPRRHPDQRYLDRMNLRNPRKLFERNCDKCGIDMKTTYSPERKEVVYCEECYKREIY